MGQGLAGRREVKRAYWGLRSQAAEVGGAGPLEHMWTLVCTKLLAMDAGVHYLWAAEGR